MSKDSVLKKQFQEKDVQRLRNLMTGKYGDKTIKSVGYRKAQVTHNEGDIWEEGSSQIISWTGGDPNLDISLYLIDVNTNTTTGIIQAGVSNTGTYQWNVSCFDCLDGPKTIYIEQDTDLDGDVELFIQSDEFSID